MAAAEAAVEHYERSAEEEEEEEWPWRRRSELMSPATVAAASSTVAVAAQLVGPEFPSDMQLWALSEQARIQRNLNARRLQRGGSELRESLEVNAAFPMAQGHVFLWRADQPWQYFDCSTAKNTAHIYGVVAASRLGWRQRDVFVVNLDGDNVVSPQWMRHVEEVAQESLASMPLHGVKR